jgi:putative transcriptional regulator
MSLEGKFLIAHPNCPRDSLFYKSVIYLYQDRKDQGSIGVIVNKPSKFFVKDVCEEKNVQFTGSNVPIYHGGPVNSNALILLHSNDWASVNTVDAGNNLRISSDNIMLEKIARVDQPRYWKLFGGLSTWAPQQLQAELTGKWPYRPENSWLIANASADIIFKTTDDRIWHAAFEACGSQMFNQYF